MKNQEIIDRIKTIENELKILRNKLDEQPTTYHGEEDQRYYFVNSNFLNIERSHDKATQNDFNCFKTEEKAEKARKNLQITAALLNFKLEHDDGKLNWVNSDIPKYSYIGYNHGFSNEVITTYRGFIPCVIFFSTEEIAESALAMLKDKKLI